MKVKHNDWFSYINIENLHDKGIFSYMQNRAKFKYESKLLWAGVQAVWVVKSILTGPSSPFRFPALLTSMHGKPATSISVSCRIMIASKAD